MKFLFIIDVFLLLDLLTVSDILRSLRRQQERKRQKTIDL